MKKILTIIAITVLAINTQAQINKQKKVLDETLATIAEMDQMLGKDFTQITSALEAVNGANFIMGECMVLGAYADEGFKKQCKSMQDEFEKMFNASNWSYENYNPNGQSLVKVKTKEGKILSSPYNGFAGSASIKIGLLVEGLDIDGYFYQSKTDSTKYIMMFPVSQMGVFVEMTKNTAKTESKTVKQINTPVASTTTNKDTSTNITTTKTTTAKAVTTTVQKNTTPMAVKVIPAQNTKTKKVLKGKLKKVL
jgi:hypothetical protein